MTICKVCNASNKRCAYVVLFTPNNSNLNLLELISRHCHVGLSLGLIRALAKERRRTRLLPDYTDELQACCQSDVIYAAYTFSSIRNYDSILDLKRVPVLFILRSWCPLF